MPLDEEKARKVLHTNYPGTHAIDVENARLDALAECVTDDPRIAATEAYLADAADHTETHGAYVTVQKARAILRGEG